jgi:hypothetical protein
VAKSEQTRAQTIETLSKVDAQAQAQAIEAAQFLSGIRPGEQMQATTQPMNE